MRKYRCVILGCGGRARMHALSYNLVTRGELVACCDTSAERRQNFAAEFEIHNYDDVVEMIRVEQPDLIHLVVGPRVRVPLMELVNAEGVKACIAEKPIAYEVRDWRALVALEAESVTKFGVSAQFRYHPDLMRCQEAMKSGSLGQPLFLDASAGGTICDQGVHVLDWAMSLNGDAPVTRVFGAVSGATHMNHPMHPGPDTTIAQLEFANDVRGLWQLGLSSPRVLDDPAYYKHCRVAAYAEKGRTLYEEFARWEIVSAGGVEGSCIADMDEWQVKNLQAQANLTNAMFDWLEDDSRAPGTHLRRSLEQWNVILGLYASALWRKPIDLPFDPPADLFEQLKASLSGEENR